MYNYIKCFRKGGRYGNSNSPLLQKFPSLAHLSSSPTHSTPSYIFFKPSCKPLGPQAFVPSFSSPAAPHRKMPVQTHRISVSGRAACAASQSVAAFLSSHRVDGSGPGTKTMSSRPGCTAGSERWWVQATRADAVRGMGSPGWTVEMSLFKGPSHFQHARVGDEVTKGRWLPTRDLDARSQGQDRRWNDIFHQGEVLVAHGAEDVDAGSVEELGVGRDEHADADRLAGLGGTHCEVVSGNGWVRTMQRTMQNRALMANSPILRTVGYAFILLRSLPTKSPEMRRSFGARPAHIRRR